MAVETTAPADYMLIIGQNRSHDHRPQKRYRQQADVRRALPRARRTHAPGRPAGGMRAVMHLDVSEADVDRAAQVMAGIVKREAA